MPKSAQSNGPACQASAAPPGDGAGEIRRVEVAALHLARDAMDQSRSALVAFRKLDADRTQEPVAIPRRERLRRRHLRVAAQAAVACTAVT